MSSAVADELQALTARPILKPASAGPVASMTSSSVISSRNNYNPTTVSVPINRSPPKGPRPAPSAYQTRIEPARIPLPGDDADSSLLLGSVSFGRSVSDMTMPSSDMPATASLVEATSTSPPPFARNHLANSISSSTSQHNAPSLYCNDIEVHGITPDPWAPHATDANTIGLSPQAPTVIDPPKPNPVVMAAEIESLSDKLGALGLINETHDQIAPPPSLEAKSVPNLMSNGISYQINDAISPLPDNSAGKSWPGGGSLMSTHRSLQIPSPTVPAPNTDRSPIATSDNLSPHSVQSTSASKSLVGSFDPSGSILSESVSWEKVEDFNDEWQELSNPHEDVLEVSESEDSDDQGLDEADVDEEDEADWQDSRQAHPASMVDSLFVPSVERRRRAAAAAAATKTNGAVTPRGTRTPTTSFAQTGRGVHSRARCASEAASTFKPRSGPVSATQPKLTLQQEQLVAELQRARTTKTVNIPAHQMMSGRRVIPLTQDW